MLITCTDEKDQERKPFRFSSSVSTPVVAAPPAEPRPPRMLTKNPNGPYRWNGAGSARPLSYQRKHQNRYYAPGFGTPPVKSGVTLEVPTPDPKGKKRRVNGPESTETITPTTSTSTIGASTSAGNSLAVPETPPHRLWLPPLPPQPQSSLWPTTPRPRSPDRTTRRSHRRHRRSLS